MTTRVLIINRQLVFAVTIKQALEQTGLFEAHAFTASDAALDYVQANPQDVALVDFTLGGRELVRELRTIVPDLAVIISPAQPEDVRRALNVQGMIDPPFGARDIIPMIEQAAANRPQPLADDTQTLDSTGQVPSRTGHLRAINEFFDGGRLDRSAPEAEEQESRPPDTLPEFSSLDSVLVDEAPSEIFEPPIGDQDTPSVPTADSGAVRQFLATRGDTPDEFDSILDEIGDEMDEDAIARLRRSSSFAQLVDSMRSETTHTPLPDRHQQFIEFILTGGMDSLLGEIERAKTGPLEDKDDKNAPDATAGESDSFEKLAAEEPPLPTLEENGTVGDLMLGVSDTSFGRVLALMKGEAVPEDSAREDRPLPPDVEEAFNSFFERQSREKTIEPPATDFMTPDAFRDEFSFDQLTPDDELSNTAQLILETALDESQPVDSFSLDDLIQSIDRQLAEHTPEVHPLPSWNVRLKPPRRAEERYIKEPDFLPEEFSTTTQPPVVDEPEPVEQTEQIAPVEPEIAAPDEAPWDEAEQPQTHEPAVTAAFEDWDADFEATVLGTSYLSEELEQWDEPELLAEEPAEQVSEDAVAESPVDDWGLYAEDFSLEVEEAVGDQTTSLEPDWQSSQQAEMDFGSAAESDQPDAALKSPEEDPRIAQIALSLTQVSLELTAEATLLTRHGEIVAVEGQLTPADIAELRDVAGRSNIGEDDARISFITLNSNNRSYMLYSRRSIGDFILSMVFAADTPLRDIRRQGKRLAEALEAVPEVPLSLAELQLSSAATALPDTAPEAPATLAPYAFVWLLRDPNHTLSIAAAGAIMAGLRMQLGEMGWHINRLQAQDEYVYLLADIPDNRPAYEMIRELKRRSAEIVHTQDAALSPATMWADSYLVMTPGRELQPDEINQFINFERML